MDDRPRAHSPTPQPPAGQELLEREVGGGLHAETTQSALTVTVQLGIGGLSSSILVVLSTVNLSVQGPFAPLLLRPVLRTLAAYVLGAVCSSCGRLLPPGFSASVRAHRIRLRIVSMALEKELKVLGCA